MIYKFRPWSNIMLLEDLSLELNIRARGFPSVNACSFPPALKKISYHIESSKFKSANTNIPFSDWERGCDRTTLLPDMKMWRQACIKRLVETNTTFETQHNKTNKTTFGHPSSLRCPHEETLGPKLPTERTAKTPVRLRGCAGWSESSLGAHATLLFMSCSFENCRLLSIVCYSYSVYNNLLFHSRRVYRNLSDKGSANKMTQFPVQNNCTALPFARLSQLAKMVNDFHEFAYAV